MCNQILVELLIMKKSITFLMFVFLIGFVSCKNELKQDSKIDAEIEQVESIEKEVDSISNAIDKDAEELEKALKELDNI